MEKVPSNSQLEIEGNRSGSVLYSRVSKYRYPLVHQTDQSLNSGPLEANFSSRLLIHSYLECEMEAQRF